MKDIKYEMLVQRVLSRGLLRLKYWLRSICPWNRALRTDIQVISLIIFIPDWRKQNTSKPYSTWSPTPRVGENCNCLGHCETNFLLKQKFMHMYMSWWSRKFPWKIFRNIKCLCKEIFDDDYPRFILVEINVLVKQGSSYWY